MQKQDTRNNIPNEPSYPEQNALVFQMGSKCLKMTLTKRPHLCIACYLRCFRLKPTVTSWGRFGSRAGANEIT
eukprot:5745571-Amphidinium_carterae.1